MEFMDTKTCQNLARSFAGESQARTRYALYAATARTEGWEYLARIFEQTAANELAHAEQFLEKIQQHGKQPIENIDVAAGYPSWMSIRRSPLRPERKGSRTLRRSGSRSRRSRGGARVAKRGKKEKPARQKKPLKALAIVLTILLCLEGL